MAKATDGPWIYTTTGPVMRGYQQPFAIAQESTANLIAGVFGDVRGGVEVAEANAHLLAASFDLLAVLQRYVNAYPAFRIKPVGAPGSPERVEQERLMALEDAARTAISKATGGNNV